MEGVITTLHDRSNHLYSTDSASAASALAFLAEASAALATSLSLDELIEAAVRLPVPMLADWCTVHLVDEHGIVQRSAGAHVDSDRQHLIGELHERFPAHHRDKGLVADALATGRSGVLRSLDDAELAEYTQHPDQARLLKQLGCRSSIAVPLIARGRTLGAMAFLRESPDAPYTDEDLTLAEELCSRIALALDNARLFGDVQDAEHRMRALVQNLDAVVWEAERSPFRYTFVSRRAEEMTGFPVSRWTDEPDFWLSMVHPDDRDDALEAVREAAEEGSSEVEYRIGTAGGATLWVRQTIHRTAMEGSRLRGLILDVTEQRQAALRRDIEHTAARVLAEAETLAEAMSEILYGICRASSWDLGDLWIVDQAMEALRFVEMWAPDELQASQFRDASAAMIARRGEGLPGRVWESGAPAWIDDVTLDDNFPRADVAAKIGLHGAAAFPVVVGARVLAVMCFYSRSVLPRDAALLATLSVIGNQVGQFIERRRAEASLRESEARKRAILEASLDAVVTIDDQGCIVELNPAAERTFEYREQDVVGRELADVIIPERLREAHTEGLRRFRETGEAPIIDRRLEMPAVRADGTEIICDLAITKVDLPGGPVFTGYLRDITDRKTAERELAFQRTLLASQSEATLDGILVTSPDGGILYMNRRFRELWRIPEELSAAESDWKTLGFVLGQVADPQSLLDSMTRVGEDPNLELRDSIELADGRIFDRWTTPLHAPDGSSYGRAWYFRDITDQRMGERTLEAGRTRAAFLAQASERLTASLDAATILDGIVDVAVPQVADLCVIDLVDGDGSVRRVTLSYADPDQGRLMRRVDEPFRAAAPSDVGILRVLRSGRTQLHAEVDDHVLDGFSHDDEFSDQMRRMRVRSVLSVPLLARGRTLGAVTLASAGRSYGDAQVELLEDLASRVALAVDNARLYEERTRVAQTLQQSLLPPHVPDIPGLEVAARYHPAGEGTEVGGDFYDLFQRSGRSWGVAIGDVCGKGAEAAVLTALSRYTVRAAAMEAWKPSRILARLNDAILRNPVHDKFCSVLYGVVEPSEKGARVTMCSGGHPLPFILRRDGGIETGGRPGTVLGLFEDVELHDATIDLGPGDALVLYTDGVTEGRGIKSTFGEDMLVTLLGWYKNLSAPAIAERVERTVVDFQKGKPNDDIAVLVLRVAPNKR